MYEDQALLNTKIRKLQLEVFQDLEKLFDEKTKALHSENNSDYELEDFFNSFEATMIDYKNAKQHLQDVSKPEPKPIKKKSNKKHFFRKRRK